MLTKENVKDFTCDYLESEGYVIIEGDTDIVAQKDQLLKVIVYGAVSDASRTSQVGKSFNKNQIKMNIGMAVYEIMKLKDQKFQFAIALPDNKLYGRVVKEIKVGLESFQIQLLLCNEQGIVKRIC